jgi:uncharacterized protein YjbI with pentapeptide repeats
MTKHWTLLITASLTTLLALFAPTPFARADIFEWEYLNPANPALGKQQSATLAPDGAGVSAEPGVNLSNHNLTKAYLIGANLSSVYVCDDGGCYFTNYPANLSGTNLSQADLSGANLTLVSLSGANLTGAELTGANLTGAEVRAANFTQTGITVPQLYSTASYQAHDLAGIGLYGANLSGANFAGQNLTNATLMTARLTGANFTGAHVQGASVWLVSKAQLYSTASYQAKSLSLITLYSTETAWNFVGQDLTGADLRGMLRNANFSQANLTNARISYATLTNSNLSQANLTNAVVDYANLTGASLTGAVVRGAHFYAAPQYPGSSLTVAQLYSTASYQAHDLTGLRLVGNDLTAANLAGQNLTNASFARATLTGANFAEADVRGANFYRDESRGTGGISASQLYSTASYEEHDLSGIDLESNDLAGVNFAGQNLTNARFILATLTDADFRSANLTNARFSQTNDPNDFRSEYGANLNGADLSQANLTNAFLGVSTLINANLSEANLTNANLAGGFFFFIGDPEYGGGGYFPYPGADLTGANLSHANLTNANFSTSAQDYFDPLGAILTSANLRGADARGANFEYATLTGANTTNLIQSDGHIAGLDLTDGASLVIRDYDGNPTASPPAGPLSIVVEEQLTMDATGTLRLVFDADPWDSLISFAPGIPVALGGTLELTFAADVDVATQSGRTIDLFDWTGVTPTGAFTVESPYTWNLTNLYTTGEITLAAAPNLPGDYNNNGIVDAADYTVWRDRLGSGASLPNDDTPGVGPDDYARWVDNFGITAPELGAGSGAALPSAALLSPAVPEPTSLALLSLAAAGLLVNPRPAHRPPCRVGASCGRGSSGGRRGFWRLG